MSELEVDGDYLFDEQRDMALQDEMVERHETKNETHYNEALKDN